MLNEPPYPTVLKPYGPPSSTWRAERPEIVCLSGDLTRQCEIDLFQDELPGALRPLRAWPRRT